jgi:hypothetical protein
VIDVALQKDKTLPSCIGAWGNIGAKIATTYLCVPPPPPTLLDSSNGQTSKNSYNEILILHQNMAYIKYTYHYVCSNIGHILLHYYVVKLDSWLIPLIIVMVKVSFAISHVTFYYYHDFYYYSGKT